jgi:hypothetical protein
MGVNTRNRIITDGLVLNLDAGNRQSYTSGNTDWRDISGNNYTGVIQSGVTFNNNVFTFNGNSGTSVDTVGNNINFGDILDLGTNNRTINIWFNLNTSINTAVLLLSKAFFGGQNYRFAFQVNSSYKLEAFVQGNGGSDIFPSGNTTLSPNVWYMGTMVINRTSSIQLYLNGVLETLTGNATISQWNGLDFQSTNPFRVGSYTFSNNISPNFTFSGRMGVVQVYNRALTQQEITQNFNATRTRYGI